ncbi:MAG: hypothetical protein CL923_02435 [Deltaproteobacteria bacterium]|nr:hypothetical protein [Deltaproteobacteria bacterium]
MQEFHRTLRLQPGPPHEGIELDPLSFLKVLNFQPDEYQVETETISATPETCKVLRLSMES